MNLARFAALVFAVSLACSAVSGAFSSVAAQGGAVDTPSGCGLKPVGGDPEAGAVSTMLRGIRLVRLTAPGHSPIVAGLLGWSPVRRATTASSSRFAALPGERLPVAGPANRQRFQAGR